MHLAHKIQLDPTAMQVAYFKRACGVARFVWNWALNEWGEQYAAGGKPNGRALSRYFNSFKYEQYPWLREVHRDTHSQPFANLQRAFNGFFKGTTKYPKFKKKGVHDSFYVANDCFRVAGKKVRLPKIGWVKMWQELRFTGKIMSATVSRQADRWFISISVDVGDYKKQRTGDGIVGVDLGIKIALSDGAVIPTPMPLKTNLRRLKLRQGSLSRKKKGSNNREKQKTKVARTYARISNIRKDFLHKLTTKLCRENQAVGVESLCVKSMLKSRGLSRAILDVGFAEFLRQMGYKATIYDTDLMVADRWFPSSKTCSQCGRVKDKLPLSERTYRCECGLVLDRDVNAAKNLKPNTVGFTEIHARGQKGSDNAVVNPCLVEPRTNLENISYD